MGNGGRSLADTHAHLDAPEFGEDSEAVVQRAQKAGINRILSVGTDLASSRRAVDLARRFESVYAAVGVDPHSADRFAGDAAALHELLQAEKVVAVGEIGLDFVRPTADRGRQMEIFAQQLLWAKQRSLPVSVHNREADEEVIEKLQRSHVTAVLHCFSGSVGFAREALEVGCYISFAGNVTFRNAGELRTVASIVPIERLLVESDAPVLAPQPWRGRRNEPAYISSTVAVLAEVRGISVGCLVDALRANAEQVFTWASA